MRFLKPYLILIIVASFFLCGLFGRIELDNLRKERLLYIPDCPLCEEEPWEEEPLYIPSGRLLPYLSIGHDQLLADLLWLKALLYFGKHYLTDKNYPYFFHLLDIITSLDKRFKEVYLLGGIILSLELGAIQESNMLLEKGMENIPYDWRMPFYIGFNYWYYLNDHIQAARYISIASKHTGAPSYLSGFAGTLYLKGGQKEVALRFLVELYNNTEDERIKEQIRDKIEEIQRKEK